MKWKHEKLISQSEEHFSQISAVLEGIAQAYYQQFTMIPKITHKINTVSNG